MRCPSCNERGSIEVSEEAIKPVTRGLLAVNVASNIICEHTFIAYIDNNLAVRDYFVADFHVLLPEITPNEEFEEMKFPDKEVMDVDLIKLNLTATLLTNVLKSIFSKQKIVIISDQDFLHEHILNFFKYIFQNSFDINISLISENEYNKNKKQYKDNMVLHGSEILRNNNKIINPKKLWIEKQIINKFMTEHELGLSYIKLRNEIRKVYRFSKEIAEFVEKNKDKEKPNALIVKKFLEEKYHTKIDQIYINFLIEIIEINFGIVIPSMTESLFGIL